MRNFHSQLNFSNVVIGSIVNWGSLEHVGGGKLQLASLGTTAGRQERGASDRSAVVATSRRQEVRPPAGMKTVMSGFSRVSRERITEGSWKPALGGIVRQTDPTVLSAKAPVSLSQNSNRITAGITGKALGSGRIGYGFHFMASDVKKIDNWGFGKSYLIWLTRDVAFYGNNGTYLQVYESLDDGRMFQRKSIKISENIASKLNLEATYERNNRSIVVSVNGNKKLEYKVWVKRQTGDQVALRSLGGPVEFSSVYVFAK